MTIDAPLIERSKFFGNPTRTNGQISPDGRWLSWLAPRDGVLNIWVAPRADPAAARALTDETVRPIRSYFWSPDSSQVLFVNDQGGDENFKLYGVAAEGGEARTLTPFDKTRTEILKVSPQVKDRVLVGVNNRDPRWHDVYALDLASGALSLVFENDGFRSFLIDEGLVVRGGARSQPDGGVSYYRIEDGVAGAEPSESVSFDDSATVHPVRFTEDGKTLYWIDSRGRDTAALIAEDMVTGARAVLAEDPRVDILNGLFNPMTGKVEAYAVTYLTTAWIALDPGVKADLGFLQGALKGEISINSRTDANDLWVVSVDTVTGPPAAYLYDRTRLSVTQLYVTKPELVGVTLAAMHPVEIRSRDGLVQTAYLTLPPGSDPAGSGKPASPVPLVLVPHGGPWARDVYGYNPWHQFLANRGYAVLSPNFRASTGFGKAFMAAGNLEWGARMHDDLLDAVNWAVEQGVTTADQVAIMGGSYGGYAVLAGLAFTPEVFACGVDLVGPSNLNTLMSSLPPYWESFRIQMLKWVGDPGTPDGEALLKARSPLTRADAIVRPLLIAQGANDPRVKQAESDQIVTAMQAKSIPVTYLLFPDEGHGFAHPQNSIAFFAAAEHFLAACLGGRAEPFGDALKGSSLTVPAGVEFAPGLEAALKT